ncbi:fas-binding factor 1 [Tribolium madens]|uniref:fas-binding factor 1 n=1 Tax=Tribolium madens TaxID=41895 RepID=UPI001CF766C3|nr:fas-binding factor 1 [Tribolium madens]
MDFGDDPLGDVLSDGSNDSFFDEPRPASKRASLTKTPEKKSITDLFNITDKTPENNQVPKRPDDWLGLDSKDTKSPSRTQKLAKKISFDDDDDILGNLGLTKRPQSKPETHLEEKKAPSKKLDLLESILGPSKSEDVNKPSTFEDILKESKAKTATPTATPKLTPSNPPTEPLLLSEGPREGRRRRRSSAGLLDPLGLFSSETKIDDSATKEKTIINSTETPFSKPTPSKSTPNIISDPGLPEWLGGGSAIKQSKSENILPTKESKPEPAKQEPEKNVEPINESDQSTLNTILTQQKLAHSHMEYQNTAITLQQQESQLLMALQLKKYEDNLSEMQMKQQEVIMKQEQQFNMLLERQFAKQQIMENNMRLQQERINNHIQMLLAQPPIAKHLGQEEMDELKKTASEESVKLYENIINSLKQRQHEEIFLLEESYKKQINLLEQSLESVEKRLKNDVEKISEVFEKKLKAVQEQHDNEITKYKQKIHEAEIQHSEEIKQIRESNSRVIEEVKYEYSTLLENVKEAKKSETSLFQESNTYLQKLDDNIEILYANSKSLGDLKDHIYKDYGILSRAREESLKAKEQEIILMRSTLEKCREEAEKERAELLALVRTLETKIAEQNQNAREERWAFQQAASTLAARSAALDREAEFNRTAFEREREQLKTLRESILAEQEKTMLQLSEEKLSLAAEKSRFETSNKLMVNYDSQKAKAEIDAAVQIAKEAAEMADKERESLNKERCEMEKLKRSLQDHKRKLNLRETEVENLMKEAENKKNEGEKAIFESKTIENKYNERLRDLQNQLNMLANREKKLAEEKIALSKERLSLNTLMRQSKKCSLCSADPQKLEESNLNINSDVLTSYFSRFDHIDNDILRLRLEATEENLLNINHDVPS